jgi:hypothetical protein
MSTGGSASVARAPAGGRARLWLLAAVLAFNAAVTARLAR